jgi:phosphonate transport system substrate-binding protein
MKRRSFVAYSLCFAASLTVVACSGADTSVSDRRPETLKFAVTDVQGLEELQRDYDAFKIALETATGRKFELFPVADRAAAAVALQSDQVDIVFTGPAEYVVLQTRTKAVPLVAITRPNYKSVFAVHGDSDIKAVSQLKGKKVALSDLGSTSGHLGPAKILVDAGLNIDSDLEILLLGDGDLQAFKNRETEAWGGSYVDYERFLEAEGAKPEDYPLIVEGPMLPSDVLVASATIAADYLETLREQLTQNQDKLIEALVSVESNRKFKGSKIVPVEDADYNMVRDAYRAIGVNDFNEFVGD